MSTIIEILNSSGNKIAQLDERECKCKIRRVLNGEWSITIDYPIPSQDQGEDKSQYLHAVNAIARVKNTETGTYQQFVLNKPERERQQSGSLVLSVKGEHISIVAMSKWIVSAVHDFQNVTPQSAISTILGYMSSDTPYPAYSVGTISPSALISVYISYESVLSALQKILTACSGEYDVDEANSEIDVYSLMGSASKYINIRYGRNLKGIKLKDYSRDVVNKIYGIGAGQPPATIAGARHVVKSVSFPELCEITLNHNKLVPENNCWNSYYIKMETGVAKGLLFQIVESTHFSDYDKILVDGNDFLDIATGNKFSICDSNGDPIAFIPATTSMLANGTLEGVFQDTKYGRAINLVSFPFFDSTYHLGVCNGWTKEGAPTVSENTNSAYIQYGSKSQRVQGSASNQGISQVVSVIPGKTYRIKASVWLESGSVKVIVNNYTAEAPLSVDIDNPKGWREWNHFIQYPAGSSSAKIMILQSGAGSSDFYVDAVQMAECLEDEAQNYTENCEALNIWFGAFDLLMKTKDAQVEYQCNFIDLHAMDPIGYPFEEIALGDTVIITDEELGISGATARVKELNYDPFRPELTEHVVSNA